ncbi:Mip1 [Desulforapulum autotrophicum HRM2]|uniref:Peptidyl-prolyl cis-trans isomerase n=1 Tax=Desulforapulum autotrophicum (strain ATCC 43914 / DSM 3382 / VKM B-1955 / HRM2) TaxID=177437 RepID=C0QDG7_DESAH|nr:FKBP-type peptidyl-prolyl cis-trans isomerase [Desulforapulum autotrophicum]ACN15231.1 Mip1 [Desulforapulum autotrophicum HRM2]
MKVDLDKVSYVLGQSVGGDFKRQGIEINPEIFTDSFIAAFNGKESKMPVGEMQHIMQNFQRAMQDKKQAEQMESGKKNIEAGKIFLEENSKKEDVKTTESGLQYKVITQGSGKKPAVSNTVETHYEGKTLDGVIFDSSYKRGQTTTFPVNGVIKGWTEALQLMAEGSKYELYIPSELAYGAAGSGSTIEPYSTLIFTVELIAVK